MRRVLVCGISGVGKTTFARALAGRLGLPFHEMDAMFHGPAWEPISTFVEDVRRLAAEPAWVLDSQGYSQVRDLLWARADTAIWLDFSRAVVLRRVLARSTRRALGREQIFNGNRERFRDWFDPEHPVLWSMTQYGRRARDLTSRFEGAENMTSLRFARPTDAQRWLDGLARHA